MSVQYLNRNEPGFERQLQVITEDTSSPMIVIAEELRPEDAALFAGIRCIVIMLHYWDARIQAGSIMIDSLLASRLMVNSLLEKAHHIIGYLRSEYGSVESQEREEAVYTELLKHGIRIRPEHIITLSTVSEDAVAGMKEWLAENEKVSLPTAFIADSDRIAVRAMKALQEEGIDIPGRVSIVGYGDMPFSSITTPALTSIRVPRYEIGSLAVKQAIAAQKEGKHLKMKILVPPELIERDSVIEAT